MTPIESPLHPVHEGPVPLVLVLDSGRDQSPAAPYYLELLAHAGLPYRCVPAAALAQPDTLQARVLLLPHLRLMEQEREGVRRLVAAGAGAIGLGGTSGLDDLFGVRSTAVLREGFAAGAPPEHVITAGLRSSLHFFGARPAYTLRARTLLAARDERATSGALALLTETRHGRGLAIFCGVDLAHTVLEIQLGRPIYHDGPPAPDGTAPIDDGILKTDDGTVLHYEHDRITGPDNRFFGEPIADEWRAVLLKAIFYTCRSLPEPVSLPMLWYWPDGLDAIGHLSHDSDGNQVEHAWELLARVAELGISSTWCCMLDGYPPEVYEGIKRYGSEIALHYDARTGTPRTTWSEENFRAQLAWLKERSSTPDIVTNKNHYLRWEGRLDFFAWCERAGIQAEQSKGPSKSGNVGFIYGGCHPWVPFDAGDGRFLNVLEVNLFTQDLVLTTPYSVGPHLVDRTRAHYGVAHFLFHPAHVFKPGIAQAMQDVVRYAQHQGMPWWTCRQLNAWERARRSVRFSYAQDGGYTVSAAQRLARATLLELGGHDVVRYGFGFHSRVVDLEAGSTVQVG
jgi:hypothetical protein